MMFKKIVALLLALALPMCAAVAEQATALPFSMTFQMDYDTVLKNLDAEVTEDNWGDETGDLIIGECATGIGDLHADSVNFRVDRNNSAKASRLSQISMYLTVGDNCIADFRLALAALTAVYGAPDGDPFSEEAVQYYVEYGNLSANWTTPDTRINLYMSRMYDAYLTVDFTNRLCYDADDLKE